MSRTIVPVKDIPVGPCDLCGRVTDERMFNMLPDRSVVLWCPECMGKCIVWGQMINEFDRGEGPDPGPCPWTS